MKMLDFIVETRVQEKKKQQPLNYILSGFRGASSKYEIKSDQTLT